MQGWYTVLVEPYWNLNNDLLKLLDNNTTCISRTILEFKLLKSEVNQTNKKGISRTILEFKWCRSHSTVTSILVY